MVVRPATISDLDQIMRLEAATPEAPRWERAAYEGFLSDDHTWKRIFVAVEGIHLVGFVAAEIVLGVCSLDSIVVHPGARRQGLGRALFATLMEWLREHHATRVELEVRVGNTTTIGFYEGLFFQRDGLRRGYYRDPDEDALLMSRSLELVPKAGPGGGKLSLESD